jgi:UDPglucose 6-dehydrogenase
MRVAVIGTGYVGLVSSAGFSDFGNDVICVGNDAEQIARLDNGQVDFYEPGLPELIRSNHAAGRIKFTVDLEEAVRAAEVVVIALRVPVSADGNAELEQLFKAVDRIGKVLDDYKVIALKSTVPVGTTERLAVRIGAISDVEFGMASNPAFLKEGDAINDFMKPDRVVIGTRDERAADMLHKLYAPFVRARERTIVCDPKSAELAKHAASALLASRISFINELALLAGDLGADIETVRRIMGADARIGPKALFVSPGFGGSCFQGDIAKLLASAKDAGRDLTVVQAAAKANARQKQVLLTKLRRHLGDLEGKTVALWGLAFKPRTDHVGEAPSLTLIDGLLADEATVRAHDPRAINSARRIYGDRVTFADSMYDAVEGAHALVLLTEWQQYRRPDFERIAGAMRGKLVLDGRNIWDPAEMRGLGLRYVCIGRP